MADQIKDPDKVQDVDVDTSKLEEEIRDQVIEEVTPKITKEVTAKATQQAKEDLAKVLVGEPKGEQSPWAKEGRTPIQYEEVADYGAKKAVKEVREMLDERDKKATQATKEKEEADIKSSKDREEYWDKQVKKLTEEGHIPEVEATIQKKLDTKQALTQEDQEDPGIKARVGLYKAASESKEPNLELVYHRDMAKKPVQAGSDAPVFGAQRATTPDKGEDFTYEEVHNAKSFSDLLPK